MPGREVEGRDKEEDESDHLEAGNSRIAAHGIYKIKGLT